MQIDKAMMRWLKKLECEGYRVYVTCDQVTKEEMGPKRRSIAKVVCDPLRNRKNKRLYAQS